MQATSPTRREFDAVLQTARQTLYRFASLAFLDPRAGAWKQLADDRWQTRVRSAAEWIRAEPAAVAEELGLGEQPLDALVPDAALARLPHAESDFHQEFDRTFGLLVTGACTPYETEYIDSKLSFQRSQQLADIAGFYRAFGWRPSRSHPERHDALVLELEFIALLIELEMRAAGNPSNGNDRAAVCHDAQTRFLREHLAWWLPAFARLLAIEHPGGFFAEVARLLTAFLPAERALLGIAPPHVPVQPYSMERPDECAGCPLTL